MPFISKSKYLAGLQCDKLLWTHYNAKDRIPSPDAGLQAIFDQGHEVGELAKSLYPGGIEVAPGTFAIPEVLRASQEAAHRRKPLFEAGFAHGNAYARVDILNPVGKDQWDLIEVKSSTQVKEINLHDVAFQRYTYEGAGFRIRKCFLVCINNEYVRKGEIDPEELFVRHDITEEVRAILPGVKERLGEMTKVIARRKEPDVSIGPQCDDPYVCPLHNLCWDFLPEQSVFTLYRGGAKSFALLATGVQAIADIPHGYKLSAAQGIQVEAVRSEEPHIDEEALGKFLRGMKYPLSYLDFETIGTAIPLFDGVRPYQQVPFQFSLHIVKEEGAKPEHHGFLASGREDPREEILAELKALLGTKGSIVAYNAGFEKRALKESVAVYRKYQTWYEKIEPRFVDLLQPFRAFHYYHPDQQGSASIKSVLPALTGSGYEGMEIADGGTASQEFLRITFGDVPARERQTVRKRLEEYCKKDTMAMVEVVEAIEKICGKSQ